MPAKLSAQKRHRQSQIRHQSNRAWKRRLHTAEKDLREKIDAPDTSGSAESFRQVSRLLSRAASRGIIHPRKASRKISRLSRLQPDRSQ